MSELPRLRFIPFRRADVIALCRDGLAQNGTRARQFELAREKIERYFQHDFHRIKQQLKDSYAPIDPDADTRMLQGLCNDADASTLADTLAGVLERANYEKVTAEAMQRALKCSSLFQVRLYVDLDDFDEVLLYTRGASKRQETLRELFGLWPRTVRFTNYDRVLLYIRLKPDIDNDSTLGDCQPGSTILRLFQNVPEADLEMLFPNIRVGMRLLDKLMIGIPALISGAVVMTTKMGATLLLLGSLLGFWLGTSNQPVDLDKGTLIALGAGVAALAGYFWKQYSSFRNRKLKYTQALTENLYFKLLDNNAGAIFRILDDAEDSECKESLLAYYFLLTHGEAMTAPDLDATIERWMEDQLNCSLDFEVDDALDKLLQLELASFDGTSWRAVVSAV